MPEAIVSPETSLARCVSEIRSSAPRCRAMKSRVCSEVALMRSHLNGHARLYRLDCLSRLCQFAMPTLWQSCSRIFRSSQRAPRRNGRPLCYFIVPNEQEGWREVRARMFFYCGEDAATGSAAGCGVSWIVPHGSAKSDEQILIRQRIDARRPSEIFVRASRDGEKVNNIRVGGYAMEVMRGTVNLSSPVPIRTGSLLYRRPNHAHLTSGLPAAKPCLKLGRRYAGKLIYGNDYRFCSGPIIPV